MQVLTGSGMLWYNNLDQDSLCMESTIIADAGHFGPGESAPAGVLWALAGCLFCSQTYWECGDL